MDNTTNALNWFEIPALDLKRSTKFYETVFQIEMQIMEMDGTKMAFFPMEPGSGKASGGVIEAEGSTPSTEGTTVYLNANPKMDNTIARVEEAGGKVLLPKTAIGGNGFMAYILDTEGNKVGVHSIE